MKTWFITGISRGLGLALAKAALADGDTVIGTVRSGAPNLPAGAGTLHVLTLDLADGDEGPQLVVVAARQQGIHDPINRF